MERNKIHHTDCYLGLKSLPKYLVDSVVTSPPYYGLRNYGIDPTEFPAIEYTLFGFNISIPAMTVCLGLEETPEAFIGHMVLIFDEVYRVLKPMGTLWVNMGDSYATGAGGGNMKTESVNAMSGATSMPGENGRKDNMSTHRKPFNNNYTKPKDMMGIPWMLAFALRERGWYLRQDIIWAKPNPMPESCTDRCTKSHEYIFLFSKQQKYYFDAEAIKQESKHKAIKMPDGWDTGKGSHGSFHRNGREKGKTVPLSATFKMENSSRSNLIIPNQNYPTHRENREDTIPTGFANKRSVWTVASEAFSEAHFATFPQSLIVDCIRAGSSQYGCCKACGNPYERIVDKQLVPTSKACNNYIIDERDHIANNLDQGSNRQKDGHKPGYINETSTIGWKKTCKCATNEIVPALVMDIFGGSGTTGIVAKKQGRDYILMEKKAEYVKIANNRFEQELGMFAFL